MLLPGANGIPSLVSVTFDRGPPKYIIFMIKLKMVLVLGPRRELFIDSQASDSCTTSTRSRSLEPEDDIQILSGAATPSKVRRCGCRYARDMTAALQRPQNCGLMASTQLTAIEGLGSAISFTASTNIMPSVCGVPCSKYSAEAAMSRQGAVVST